MKDEIKEILQMLEAMASNDDIAFLPKQASLLLDYITNLQEENKRLKELCDKYEEEHNTAFKLWTMKMEEIPTYEEKKELQNRIDKSIEYINRYEGKATIKDIYESELKSILQGSDE